MVYLIAINTERNIITIFLFFLLIKVIVVTLQFYNYFVGTDERLFFIGISHVGSFR